MKRRNFIKSSATAAASFSLIPSTVLGKTYRNTAPSDKVNLAYCGIGFRGGSIINSLFATGHENIVAFYDLDMGAPHTLEILKKFQMYLVFKISERCLIKWVMKLNRVL